MSVVEPELTLLEVKIKGVVWDSFELPKPVFGEPPERFDTVDVVVVDRELALTVTNPKVFLVSDIDQAVIADPTVGVNHRVKTNLPPNKAL